MAAGFSSVQHVCHVTRMQPMRTAQVQDAPRPQNAEKIGGHVLIPEQMFQFRD
jgi:hypothetical protein